VADAPLDALLEAASGAARAATGSDAIDGAPARYVASPATPEEAAAVVRAAAEHDLAIVVRGGGSKQGWATPPRRLDLVIDTTRLAGVVEHEAGDLIAVVRAGTPAAELGPKLAAAGQQLALDLPLAGATIGGTVAVNTSGPRRMQYGTIRDLLIGIQLVRPDGTLVRAGGKVVKNVAGYDLGKLLTGSYGTLGLIVECAFRLHPLPAATAVLRREVHGPPEAGRLAAAVLGAQVVPSALEVNQPPSGPVEVAVLLEGVPAGVAGRADATARLLGAETTRSDAPPWWGQYPWQPGEVGLKLTAALSGVSDVLAAARRSGERHGVPITVRGSAGTGVLYAGLPPAPEPVAGVLADLRKACADGGGHAVVLTAPPAVRDGVDMWGPIVGLDLMRRVKLQFDQDARFAPGRFVGGI
jgi:glycolate oxidase FAD binding subunit